MEAQQFRGRSPSVGHQTNQGIRQSPSPQPFQDQFSPTDTSNAAVFPQAYNHSNLSPVNGAGVQFNVHDSYLDSTSHQSGYQPHILPSNDFSNRNFEQSYQANDLNSNNPPLQSQSNAQHPNAQYQAEMINVDTNFGGFPPQQDFAGKQRQYDLAYMIDPQLENGMQPQEQSINPADIMSNMSSPQNIDPTPPTLMPPHTQGSEPTSPFTPNGQQYSPHHSRHTSLDPTQVYSNGQQQSDWTGMLQGPQFQRHRRAPSEHSDVSSSAHPSPYMAQQESYESYEHNPSPMLNPQQDTQLYQDGLGIETFNLSEPNVQNRSPGHSPFVSPRMSPQRGLSISHDTHFVPLVETQNNYNGMPAPTQTEAFPQFPPEQRLGSNDYGQADQYDVPQINVEVAPSTRQPNMEPARFSNDLDTLSPPERGRKARTRAKSDTYVSRPVNPSSNSSTSSQRKHSLSPNDVAAFSSGGSRDSSPAPRSSSQRRSSTSSIPNRDYILELADPSRPAAPGTEKRIQKHPATFQCHLCPKKFTRAYNLRSHLRTHTDERPFVCTVCTKAFARQHDRKRHEGLHSGEKKFVCRGELGIGGSWGCGRRFARADALGRHFRSEAGRVCIKPLLDEEAMERQRVDIHMMNQIMPGGPAPQAPLVGMSQQNFGLPQALLLQYPALQGIDWGSVGPGGPGDEGELSGRSSFDASSEGGYYDDDEVSGYASDNPMGSNFSAGGNWQSDHGWKSDIGD